MHCHMATSFHKRLCTETFFKLLEILLNGTQQLLLCCIALCLESLIRHLRVESVVVSLVAWVHLQQQHAFCSVVSGFFLGK